jgi:hypothetical protein
LALPAADLFPVLSVSVAGNATHHQDVVNLPLFLCEPSYRAALGSALTPLCAARPGVVLHLCRELLLIPVAEYQVSVRGERD